MKRSDFAAILFFLALAVLFFAPVLFGNASLVPFDNLYRFPPWRAFAEQNGVAYVHNPLLDDLILENYAWKNFINESLRAREIPLWNPYIFAGQPFLAAGQNAALYPFGIVFYIMPLARAYAIFAALHYWLAACAMYFLARVLGLRAFASIVSGIIYAFGGFMVVSVVFPMVVSAAAWLPAILACVELVLRNLTTQSPLLKSGEGETRRYGRELFFALGAGILLGVQFLAGHVEISYYILLVVAFYSAWRIVGMNVSLRARTIHWRGIVRAGAVMFGIVALGFALAAVQILPLYELVRENFREGSASYAEVAGWALPSRQILTFFIPDFFGNPTHHAYFDLYEKVWKPAPQGTIFWGIKNYVEAGAYVGILALVLTIVGIVSSLTRRSLLLPLRSTFFFLTLAILSLLFAFGTPLYALLFYGLPGWNQLHTAFRWIFPWTLSVAFLAGVGVEYLTLTLSLERRGKPIPASVGEENLTPTLSQNESEKRITTDVGEENLTLTLSLERRGNPIPASAGEENLTPTLSPNESEKRITTDVSEENLTRTLSLERRGKRITTLVGEENLTLTHSLERREKRITTLVGALLAVVGIATLLVVAVSFVAREMFVRFADAFVNASDLAKPVFETGQAFWSYQARNLALFGLFVLLAGIVFLVARANWRVKNVAVWKPLAIVVLVLDLFVAGIGFYPRADLKLAEFVPPALQFLQQDKSLFRIASYDVPGEKMLNANSAMPFGIQDIRGYDSIIAKQYVEYMQLLAPQEELLYNRIAAFYEYAPLRSPLLHLLNVKYIVTSRPVPFADYPLVYDGEIKIYENPNVLPRAFFVPTARVFENRDELLRALPSADVTREVLLETSPLTPLLTTGGGNNLPSPHRRGVGSEVPPTFEKYTGSEVILKTNLAEPAWLVLTDTYFPGWLAQLDGEDVPLYRANGNFRAVQVPAGEHTVRFKYSPLAFRVGAVLSFLAGIAVLLALVAMVWQKFVIAEARVEGSQVRTVAKNSLVPMGASLLIQVINFALALVVLRVLGPTNNGNYAFAVTVWFFLSAITEFGLGILVTREVARDRSRANVFLSNAIVLRLGLTVLSIILLGALVVFYRATSELTNETVWAMVLLWVSLFPNHAAAALSGMFYAYERFEYPTAIEIATALVSVALQIAALLAGYGIVGLAGVSIVTNLFTFGVMYYLVRRLLFKPQFVWDRPLARWMFVESYPLMMNNLLANLFFKIDVFLLLPLTNATVLGYYNAAYKFVNALNFIPSKFTLAMFPMLARLSTGSTEAMQRAMIVSVKLLTWIAVPITVATVFVAEPLILLFAGAAYLPDSAIALQWLIFFLPFSFINSVVHYVLIALNEQRFLTRAFLIGLVFNLAANWIAIPALTYRGAALVTVLSEFALLIPFYYALRKHMPPLPILDMFWRPALAGFVMGAVLYFLVAQNILLALLAATIAYGVVLLVTGAMGADEWLLVGKLVPKRFAGVVRVISKQ